MFKYLQNLPLLGPGLSSTLPDIISREYMTQRRKKIFNDTKDIVKEHLLTIIRQMLKQPIAILYCDTQIPVNCDINSLILDAQCR